MDAINNMYVYKIVYKNETKYDYLLAHEYKNWFEGSQVMYKKYFKGVRDFYVGVETSTHKLAEMGFISSTQKWLKYNP